MDRRQEILDAATKSFSLFGYKATTIEQVAKVANVGKGTIYTFFDNKEVLLQEVVVSLIREMKVAMDMAIDPSVSFIDNAHMALMKMLQFREKHVLFAKLVEEEKALRTPAVKEMLQVIETEIISYIAGFIQISIDKGQVNECDPPLVAYLLLKSYLAFVVDWQQTHDEPLNEEKILMTFKQTIFSGLTKK
ncbi:TetR/AcrR family transcriptional regulator [Lysinibacillus odysseyi]|uniref:TetR family transcriptional regulator n=1 Tax=Lysinibacillus odysseyi 34hs-1 = NBRC 100172 TaxID=1220589 RepID=A0A0A3IIS5_9BACI|nr:TetR/AcrR family transcriptional regulator [Lysinibacillus odysseyi]KGR82718.1 TetR family transcriptional regulator [Lysinibacillus odysseyi 34hs-1 = NBRC 100172]